MELIHIIVACALGAICGIGTMKLTDRLIAVRLNAGMKAVNIKCKGVLYIWMCTMALVFTGFFLAESSWLLRIESVLIVCICASIGMVDISIRRVPNQLLLSLLCLKVVMTVIDIAVTGKFEIEMLTGPVIGLFLAYLVFTLPVQLGIQIGAGDVKYAAVVGFYFGLMGFFRVMAVAGIGVFGYYLYLRITKKGNRKSLIAMGPFISLGVIMVMFLNAL